MFYYCKLFVSRLIAAWMVLRGQAIPVPIFGEDTSIVVIETEGSRVSYLSCRSYVESEEAYNMLLTKIILCVCSHNRLFWVSDQFGSQLKDIAEDYFEEHKNSD